MKQFIGLGNNVRHAVVSGDDGDRVDVTVELIMFTTEPTYTVDAAGQFVKSYGAVETFRVGMSPAALRDLAKTVSRYADEADALNARLTVEDDGDESEG